MSAAGHKACSALYWLALAVWLGAIMAGAIAAAFVFGTLPELGVSLDRYRAFNPGEADAHGMLAAGHIMERIFTTTAFMRIAAAIIVLATLIIQVLAFGHSMRRPANIVRMTAIVIAILVLGYHVAVQSPDFNAALRDYWAAAEAGDHDAARTHHAAMDTLHPRMELAAQIEFVLIVTAIIASAVAMTPATPRKDRSAPDEPVLATRRSVR